MLEIQKGEPLWPISRSSGGPIKRRKYPLEVMEVGDLLFFPGRINTGVSSYISRESKKLAGRKFRTRRGHARQVSGRWERCSGVAEGALFGTAVWRVE